MRRRSAKTVTGARRARCRIKVAAFARDRADPRSNLVCARTRYQGPTARMGASLARLGASTARLSGPNARESGLTARESALIARMGASLERLGAPNGRLGARNERSGRFRTLLRLLGLRSSLENNRGPCSMNFWASSSRTLSMRHTVLEIDPDTLRKLANCSEQVFPFHGGNIALVARRRQPDAARCPVNSHLKTA